MRYRELQISSIHRPCKAHFFAHFLPNEVLFRRVKPSLFRDGHPLAESFRNLRQGEESVNRGKYSSADCVRCDQMYRGDYSDWPVVGMYIRDLKRYNIGITHKPDEKNDSHCTLGFLSEVDEEAEAKLKQELAEAMEQVTPVPPCGHRKSIRK